MVLDVAIGIRPQLAGRGWGGELGRAAVAYARSVALDRRVRTTVPDWNAAGQHAAGQAGFTPLESASTTSSVTRSSSNPPEPATHPSTHPTPPPPPAKEFRA